MPENLKNLLTNIKPQIQEAQRTSRIYHIQEARKGRKHLTFRRTRTRITEAFSSVTMKAKRKWSKIFKVLKEKNPPPRILYLMKLSFKGKEEIKTFSEKQKLRKFITNRYALQLILKEVLQEEGK